MNFDKYQALAKKTLNLELVYKDRAAMVALGLAGESGEVADMIKKHLYHGHDLSIKELTKELGDVLWYLSSCASAFGIPLSEIAIKNVDKLTARYPEGFSEFASINRKD